MTRDEAYREGYYFPWSIAAPCGRRPYAMRWESHDPNEKTWLQLMERFASEGSRAADDFNVSRRYARRVYNRFLRWRAGAPAVPTFNPLRKK